MATTKSPSSAVPTPAPKPFTSADVKKVAPDKTQTSPPSSGSKQRLLFPLAVTVAAVLPLALGVGTIRLKASASPSISVTKVTESERLTEESPSNPHPTDRRLGDQQFLERRYEVALQYYQSVGSTDPDRLPPELLYRAALCQEGLGQWDEALRGMRIVSHKTDNPVLKWAALFGQSRLWFRLNQPGKAASVLRLLALHSEIPNAMPDRLSRECEFLIPLALAQESVAPMRKIGRGNSSCIEELFPAPLESALAWADERMSSDSSGADAMVPANLILVRSNGDPTRLEQRMIDVCCTHQRLGLVLERLAEECGWSLDLPNLSNDPSLDQVVSITAKDRPVCLLLTILCSELHSTWSVYDDRLIVTRSNSNDEQSRQMIAQTLVSLMNWKPYHRLSDQARFSLAEIAQTEGHLSEAAALYSSLAGRNSSPLAIRAAYNSAKNYFQIGDFANACIQLGIVVDGAPASELHSEAMILMGRLLLDRGETQAAIYQFRRATEANNSLETQGRAAVLLGMAYLVQDKFEEAAEAVFTFKPRLEEPAVRFAASFVTAFARWKSVTGEMRQREAGYLYRALMSVQSDPEWLGQTGQLLIGRVLLELGLDDHMAELYSRMLKNGMTNNVKAEMAFLLASYERANGRLEVAKEMWEKLYASPLHRFTNRTRLQLADVAFDEGRFKDCLELCELVESGEGISLADIQKLMGRAFEQLGEDTLAARCYAGQYPAR